MTSDLWCRWKNAHRAQARSEKFRNDVVAVAGRREPGVTLAQVAKGFGVNEGCPANWLEAADIEPGRRPGVRASESAELRELKRRNCLLEQQTEVLRRAAEYR